MVFFQAKEQEKERNSVKGRKRKRIINAATMVAAQRKGSIVVKREDRKRWVKRFSMSVEDYKTCQV